MEPVKKEPIRPDAGMRSVDHYKLRLPSWRRSLRDALIPMVRWETPVLARVQDLVRTPALDSYFAFTANLGTHTFFMIILPILAWCGYTDLCRAMVNVLAGGVFFSGFLKDMLCLPRPVSPPLQRISRSASAALEYGFPSTHSTNAVSVAVFAIWAISTSENTAIEAAAPILRLVFFFYATSIVLGRIYCGMHGFADVVSGSALGALITLLQCLYGNVFDIWILAGPLQNTLLATLATLVLVRIHPEPADDCPCFDDSVAFAGVFIGLQFGGWRFAHNPLSWSDPIPSTIPFSLSELGYLRAAARILLGVGTIFVWRGVAKPTLLFVLPPVFRVIERIGLSLPRKFFLSASKYGRVPTLRKDDNVIPPASEIPGMIKSLGHPRRRAVSIGPQSEADAYEAIAFRAHRRRESQGSDTSIPPPSLRRMPSRQTSFTVTSPGTPNGHVQPPSTSQTQDVTQQQQIAEEQQEKQQQQQQADDDKDDEEMFRKLMPRRVRYDVEVVTKLIVYSGIGWLVMESDPVLFDLVGLGVR